MGTTRTGCLGHAEALVGAVEGDDIAARVVGAPRSADPPAYPPHITRSRALPSAGRGPVARSGSGPRPTQPGARHANLRNPSPRLHQAVAPVPHPRQPAPFRLDAAGMPPALGGQPRDASPIVFPSPLDPSRPRHPNLTLWQRVRRQANIEDVRLHDLRHTFASHAVMRPDHVWTSARPHSRRRGGG